MIGFAYLGALAIALTGMVLLDRRFRLFFWRDWRLGVVFFLIWDVAGIALGIFFRGQTDFMTGMLVGPELPLEEVFFLTLLSYNTMNAYTAAKDLLAGRWRRAHAAEVGS